MVINRPEMWLTWNRAKEKFRVPVLPEKFTVTYGSSNESVDIVRFGEVTKMAGRQQWTVTFDLYLPYTKGQDLCVDEPPDPYKTIEKLIRWKNSNIPVVLVITGTKINHYMTIEKLTYYEKGGDIKSLYASMTMKEYREVRIRKIKVNSEGKATVAEPETRTDNASPESQYTVVTGDCLFNIAKAVLGDSSRWREIYELNKDIIGGNPNLIYAGQVLVLPSE